MWMSGVRFTLPAPALWSEMTFLRSVISLQSYAWSMIPPVAPEGMLFRKPVSSPDQVRARLFRDHARAHSPEHRVGSAEAGGSKPPESTSSLGATSPTAEAMRSERIQSEFESLVAHHFCFFARVVQWQRHEA